MTQFRVSDRSEIRRQVREGDDITRALDTISSAAVSNHVSMLATFIVGINVTKPKRVFLLLLYFFFFFLSRLFGADG